MMSYKPDRLLPKFLWIKICAYLPISDHINLYLSSRYFSLMFKEDDWKNIFFNNINDDIAVVCNNNSSKFWYTCCTSYIGCDTIMAMLDIIGYRKYDNAFKDWYHGTGILSMIKNNTIHTHNEIYSLKHGEIKHYRVYFKNKTFNWPAFGEDGLDLDPDNMIDIKFDCNYKIDLIGTQNDALQTIFKSDNLKWMSIIIPRSFTLYNITFDNVRLNFSSRYNVQRSIYHKARTLYISNCVFYCSINMDHYEHITITKCKFIGTRTNFLRSDIHNGISNNKSRIMITDNIYSNNDLSCISIFTLDKTNLTVSDNTFNHCNMIFIYLDKYNPKINPIIFKNNCVSDVTTLRLNKMTIDLFDNIFVNVAHLYTPNDNNLVISNAQIDNTNKFTNCDVLLPYVKDDLALRDKWIKTLLN